MSDQAARPRPPENAETDEDIWASFKFEEEGGGGAPAPAAKPADDDSFAENPERDNDAPVDAAANPPQGAAPQQDDEALWANAPPDLKAAHDAQIRALETAGTEHARRSIEGRIAAYTRRLRERETAAAQQPPPAKDEPAADPLAELAAEYPEIAKPLQEKLAPISEKLKQFDEREASRQQAADLEMDTELKANESLVDEQHPGWDKYLTENAAVFGAWIVDQPLFYRQAYLANQKAIVDPYAAIMTLDAFKQFVEQATEPPAQGYVPAEQQGLNSRRTAQLAGSASPHVGGGRPTISGIPREGDEGEIWKAFAAVDPDEKKYRNA